MKRAILLLILIPSICSAEEMKLGLGVTAGMMIPSGDFQDFYGSGPELGIEILMKGQQLDIALSGTVYREKGSSVEFFNPTARGIDDLDGRLIPILLTIRYRLQNQKTTPYIGFGGGFYFFREKYIPTSESFNDSGFGGHGVIGVESKYSDARLFLEGKLAYGTIGSNATTGASITLTSITISGGIRF